VAGQRRRSMTAFARRPAAGKHAQASGRSEAEINDGIRKKACGRKAFAGGPVAGQRRMRSDSFLACGGFPANAFLRMPSCRRLSLTPIGFWLAKAFLRMPSCACPHAAGRL
jgi:hypothetical protein